MIAHAGDMIYTECWNEERKNGDLTPGWSMLGGRKKTQEHRRRVFSYALVAIETAQP